MARKFSKLNFVDAVKIITPDLYLNEDAAVDGNQIKFTDLVINSHLRALNNITSVLNVSAIGGSLTVSDINTPTGFSRYFIKQNKLTDLNINKFTKKILTPLGVKLSDYPTASKFKTYLRTELLPKLKLNSNDLATNTSSVFAPTAATTHEYLVNNLGWLYFLNTSSTLYHPSSIVLDSMMNTLYQGKTYKINDGIKDFQSYLWHNQTTLSSIDPEIVPSMFQGGNGTYTSGLQNLDKLHTFIDVIYSPLHIDREDVTVKNAIETHLGGSTFLATTEVAGPLNKFYRAISYLFRDIDSQVENLELLTSISECPKEFLPYLSNLIGWRLRGNNEDSWRHQIKSAISLYKKKGTKRGLVDAMNTVIVNNPIDTSSAITELYESYIPNLLYYILKTDTDIFNEATYDEAKAASLGIDIYDSSRRDVNIRAAVDSILKKAVQRYPYLFFVRNEPFRVNILDSGDAYFGPVTQVGNQYFTGTFANEQSKRIAILGDPAFSFRFRGRDFPIPPWEEEKFYKNCVVTEDLLNFLKKQLSFFCVSQSMQDSFVSYTNSYTLSANIGNDLYIGNSFVFFTSSQEQPPNYKDILDNYRSDQYSYLSLWNGKSSTYDFSVCAGHFSGTFFGDSSSLYTVGEILDSLDIVDEFSPAKAVPRTRVSLSAVEQPSGIDFACPTIMWPVEDIPASSTGLSNYEVCGTYIRGADDSVGQDFGYDDSRSTVNHNLLPVFKRNQARYSNNISNSVVNTHEVVPAASAIPRRSLRRRDFYNTLASNRWYGRDGRNMPSFYNNTSSILNFSNLGYIPSSVSFAPPTASNLSSVYSRDCSITNNSNSYFGVDVSNSFAVRGNGSLSFSACDQFVRRDQLSQEAALFFAFNEKKKKAIAKEIVDYNSRLLEASSYWMNLEDSLANKIEDDGFEKFTSPVLDIRGATTSRRDGLHSIYNYYNQYFLTSPVASSLPESSIHDVEEGGPTILSHVYGPIYHNANFSIEASGVEVSSQLVSRKTNEFYNLQLQNLYAEGNNEDQDGDTFYIDLYDSSTNAKGPYFGAAEYRCPSVLSSINFIDTSTSLVNNNKLGVYYLDETQESDSRSDDNYLINNRCVMLKNGGTGLPRIQFTMRGIDPQQKNILIPEHDFELTLDYVTSRENSSNVGGGSVGILIRTKNEITTKGDRVFFAWTPRGEWEMVQVSSVINGAAGINNIVNNYTHQFSGGEEVTLGQNANCNQNTSNNSVLSYVNKDHVQKAKISFHTKNSKTKLPLEYATYYAAGQSDIYNGRNVQLHRAIADLGGKTQNYIVEIFPLPKNNSEGDYVVLDKLKVVDKTLNDAAAIPYNGLIPDVTKQLDPVINTKFVLPDGTEPTWGSFAVEGVRDLSVEYFITDLFRAVSPGMTHNYEMLNCAFNPTSRLYSKIPVFGTTVGDITDGNNKVANYVHKFGGMDSPNPNFPHDLIFRGLPYGKIPFCGICNTTWTSNRFGFNTTNLEELGTYQQSLATKVAAKRELLRDYWSSRKGFLSFNNWSPYPNQGIREKVAQQEEGGIGFYANADGPGLGCWKWDVLGNHPIPRSLNDRSMGLNLLGLARAGHASYEQNKTTDDQPHSTAGVTSWASTNPQGIHPLEEYFTYTDSEDLPGSTGTGFSWATMGSVSEYVPDSTQPMLEFYQDPNSIPFPWGMSPGAATMIDFTTRRLRCTAVETGDITQEMNAYDDYLNWEWAPGEDPLLPTMLDPMGTVASGLAIWNLVNQDVHHVPLPQGQGISEYNTRRFMWHEDPSFNEKFIGEGHGITFPPMSVYRDIRKEDLLDDQYYTFSLWVAGGLEGISTTQFNDENIKRTREGYASSAILTISPIGTANSYTRLVLALPTPVQSANPQNSATSAILTNGHTLVDASAARLREVSQPASPGSDNTIRWFRMEVTMPYDAFELDSGGAPNLGIRCTLQAYNNTYDSSLPENLNTGTSDEERALRESLIYSPCRLNTWGYMLNARPDLSDGFNDDLVGFTRKETILEGVGTRTWDEDFQAFSGRVPAIIYEGNGSVADARYEAAVFETNSPKKVYDTSGQLSMFNKSVSSIQKLTVLKDSENNESFNSEIYNKVRLYDNSGLEYAGDIYMDINKTLQRPANYPLESGIDRVLTVSGINPGTNITRSAAGIVPVEPRELLHLFRYFNKIGKGIGGTAFNTRRMYDSSAIHAASGGSRLDYTMNPDNPHLGTKAANYENFTRIDTLG
jgi:P2-related tail formation protein